MKDRKKSPKVAIILPAFNEELTIGKVIDEVPKLQLEESGYIVEVVVINNNSTDNTGAVAAKHGATVINEPRPGKGIAVRAAFNTVEADYFFMLDADYTYAPSYITSMLPLLECRDVVIGSRFKGSTEKSAFNWLNLLGNVMLSLFATIVYQRYVSDVCTGYWGFRGEVVKQLCLNNVIGFELEAKLFSEVAKKRYSLAEIPINYRKRIGGITKLSPFKDGWRIVRTLMSSRFTS
jgi:dolichol-phosphate mannosyltransferase